MSYIYEGVFHSLAIAYYLVKPLAKLTLVTANNELF